MLESAVSLKVVSLSAIVIGVLMEIFLIGSAFSVGIGYEFSLGTGIAAVGIIIFVYDFYYRHRGPKS